MKKVYKNAKLMGLLLCAVIIFVVLGLGIATMLYHDPKEPNKNNWSKRTEMSVNKSDIVGSVFQCAKSYDDNARLCSVIYTIYSDGEMGKQIYSFWCPVKGSLPDGNLSLFIDTQTEKITSISMNYDVFSGEPTKTLDEEDAKKFLGKVLTFYFDREWDEKHYVRLTCYAHGKVEVWAQSATGRFLWRQEFIFSEGEFVGVALE